METVKQWLAIVEQSGKELITQGKVSEDTKSALDTPLMSVQDYVNYIGM